MSDENDPVIPELMATILEARARDSAFATNQLIAVYEDRIKKLQRDFSDFYDAVENLSVQIDSARLERLLDSWASARMTNYPPQDGYTYIDPTKLEEEDR